MAADRNCRRPSPSERSTGAPTEDPMRHSDWMPRLQLVPAEAILFHEKPERRRTERLTERIRHDKVLRNPPIVADLSDGHYLLLDGANRVSGMRALGYTDLPVQAVDYGDESIQLKGWHHLLIQGRGLHLLDAYRALPGVGVLPVPHQEIQRLLELRRGVAPFVGDGAVGWGGVPPRRRPP